MGMIEREDVINVASRINAYVDDSVIQYVMENFDGYCSDDPASNYSEVIENIIYQLNY